MGPAVDLQLCSSGGAHGMMARQRGAPRIVPCGGPTKEKVRRSDCMRVRRGAVDAGRG